ncbi:hypothetical protein JCM7686_1122 [Paracoccus aminophilus JCM 7686]|uniref:AB hydrolase-1 domain-containing protein n=2 Tax=Paracoccus aminophilus TaxID=34003 RepID=S5YSM3_PARAH|nr:hypothetical protein JCM7686_1122 [Paracoccus aminophilus JCM 7686]
MRFSWKSVSSNLHHLAALAGLALLPIPATARDSSDEGITHQIARIDAQNLEIFSFHPQNCPSPAILLVFHGDGRAAKSYLKSARQLAERGCFSVYAPLFDSARFPGWSYHRGGLVEDGALRPESEWTVEMVRDLLVWARAQEGRPDADVYLFGHSAGAQFLSRVAAYALPEGVDRIVIANPSTYVLPTEGEAVPYGFGGLPKSEAEHWMKDYLAAPITIFLGSEDTGSKDLTMTPEAIKQGSNRLDRGQQTYEEAKEIAAAHGWPFNWELVYAEGVGHSGKGMLESKEATQALGF